MMKIPRFIRKRLLRSGIKKRKDERDKLKKELKKIHSEVCSILKVIDQCQSQVLLRRVSRLW